MSSQHDIISIHNIDNEDFKFEYDRAAGNYPYLIKAGEVKRFPRFLAAHAIKHLIDKILTKQDQKTNNKVLRREVAEQIIVDEESFQEKPKLSEAEKLQRRVDKLNQPSELEAILERRKEKLRKEEKPKEVAPKETEVKEAKEEFEGLKKAEEKPKLPEPKPKPKKPEPKKETTQKPEDKAETITLPTRDELYDFAVNTMKIEMTPKVRKGFDGTSVKQLIEDFNYPLI